MSKHGLSRDELCQGIPPKKKSRIRLRYNNLDIDSNNSMTWNCPTCTFTNKDTYLQCKICTTIKPHKNSSNDSSSDNHSNANNHSHDEKQDIKSNKSVTCPKCSSESVIIIEGKTSQENKENGSSNSNNNKNELIKMNKTYHECLKCLITFCDECKSIPFHFDYDTCQEYKDYEKALKMQFEMDTTLSAVSNNNINKNNQESGVEIIMDTCFLISNVFTIEEQIELYDIIMNTSKDFLSATSQFFGFNQIYSAHRRDLFFQAPNMIVKSNQFCQMQKLIGDNKFYYKFAKYVDKVVKIVKKLQAKQSCLCFPQKNQCRNISAIEYPVPNGSIPRHCDEMSGWILLFSLGCKPNFYIQNPKINNGFEKLIDFKSGSVLIFDSSVNAGVNHEIKSIQPNTCPKLLGDKRSKLKTTRVSVQFRVAKG